MRRERESVNTVKDCFWIPVVRLRQSHIESRSPPSQYPPTSRPSRTLHCQCTSLRLEVVWKWQQTQEAIYLLHSSWLIGEQFLHVFVLVRERFHQILEAMHSTYNLEHDAQHYFATRSCRLSLVPNSGRARRQRHHPLRARLLCNLDLHSNSQQHKLMKTSRTWGWGVHQYIPLS